MGPSRLPVVIMAWLLVTTNGCGCLHGCLGHLPGHEVPNNSARHVVKLGDLKLRVTSTTVNWFTAGGSRLTLGERRYAVVTHAQLGDRPAFEVEQSPVKALLSSSELRERIELAAWTASVDRQHLLYQPAGDGGVKVFHFLDAGPGFPAEVPLDGGLDALPPARDVALQAMKEPGACDGLNDLWRSVGASGDVALLAALEQACTETVLTEPNVVPPRKFGATLDEGFEACDRFCSEELVQFMMVLGGARREKVLQRAQAWCAFPMCIEVEPVLALATEGEVKALRRHCRKCLGR
jgi:hypothetical protein